MAVYICTLVRVVDNFMVDSLVGIFDSLVEVVDSLVEVVDSLVRVCRGVITNICEEKIRFLYRRVDQGV